MSGAGRRLYAWLDERVGLETLKHVLLDEPIPGGARWAYVFGSALAITFLIQAVTGVLLMTVYAPSATTAWASVHYISHSLRGGWLVRGMHHFGSQAMVVLLVGHLVQVAAYGAYKKPREMNWWVGLALMAITLGFALTGYLLPWDQKGYWATQVATNIAGTTPGIGPWLQQLMQGGPTYGSLTLTRFYALHVGVLPASLVALLAGHLMLFRKHGVTPPVKADLKVVDAFFPNQVWKDLAAGLVVLAVIMFLALREHGAPLDAPADPASDYPARPEWYFLPLFQLLKYFHGPLEVVGTMGIPALAGGSAFLLPLLDKKESRALGPRMPIVAPLLVGLGGVVLLTWLAMRDDAHDERFQAARVKADARAAIADGLAMKGVPPGGPLEMLAHDPELRGEALFSKHCATCHVLGDHGDKAKATAPHLDGWGTEAWALSMMRDPDANERFAHTPFKGMMPSMVSPPPDRKPDDPPFKPMKDEDVKAAAAFLASQSDPNDAKVDAALAKSGEAIVTIRCTSCHLWKGEGDDSMQGSAPELSGWGTLAWLRAQVANPATKTTYREPAAGEREHEHDHGHMPSFAGELAAPDLDLVATWTRSHARRGKLE